MSFDIWKDNTAPAIVETIAVGGVAQDVSGAVVTFSMREEGSATLKVDGAATGFVTDGTDGRVSYEWAAADTDTPGDFIGWFTVAENGDTQDTPEFQIKVLDHSLSAGALCSVFDVREALEQPFIDRSQDRLIQALILGASEAMMADAGREFAPKVSESREFELDPDRMIERNGRRLYLVTFGWRRDLRSTATVTLYPEKPIAAQHTLIERDHFILDGDRRLGVYDRMFVSPYALSQDGIVFDSDYGDRFGAHRLAIDGDWGYPSVPEDVKRIAINVVRSWLRRDVAQFALANTDEGFSAPVPPIGYELPFFAVRGLNRHRRQVAF